MPSRILSPLSNTDENKALRNSDFRIFIQPQKSSFIYNTSKFSEIFHEDVEIKYFYEGSSTLIIGSETIVTVPGDIIVINPYEFHSTVRFGEDIGKYHMIMVSLDFFTGNSAHGLNLRHLLTAQGVRFNNLIRGNERIMRILGDVISEKLNRSDSDEYYRMMVRALMTEFFLLLLRDEVRCDISGQLLDENIRYYEVIDPALQKIHADYGQRITIEELAEICGISKYHFCRIFKLVTGTTAMQYLTKYRIRIADVMLSNTRKSVSEIAWECGFPDESYFCRCYKKQQGHSPLKARAILS